MNASKSLRERIAKQIVSLPRSGIRDFFELVNSMDDVLSLGIGEPDFTTPWRVREATIYALERGHTSYTSNLGLPSLRREICRYVPSHFGVEYDPETECIITVGVSEALDLAFRALINPGDEVIYHEPCYVSYAPTIRMAHGTPVPVVTAEADGFGLKPEAIEAAITSKTKVLVLNFPNNPTGADLDDRTKADIAHIAGKHDLIVITDEIYSELRYGGHTPSVAAYPGMRERTLLLHGFSKAHAMTGYRVGYACGPQELIDAMMKIHQYTMLCASIIAQEAAVEALRHGQKDMEMMREQYRQRRNLIVNRLNAAGLPCVAPQGAFYVFPRITETGLDDEAFARELLREKKVAVVPGSAFGECGAGYVRCSYATSIEQIDDATNRIRDFVNNVSEKG